MPDSHLPSDPSDPPAAPLSDDEAYWAEAYALEPYYEPGRPFEHYRPAYEHGWRAAELHAGSFEDVAPGLADDWLRAPGRNMSWEEAEPAVRSAWARAAARRQGAAPLPLGEVVEVLNGLLVVSRDGEEGFRNAAQHADTVSLRHLLDERAADCARAAAELESEIRQLCGTPADSGSVLGAMQRGWTSLKAAFSPNDDRVVLEDCERGEAVAVARYTAALGKALPPAIHALVARQAAGARRNHEQIRRLRESCPD